MIELTVGVPMFRSKHIGWYALESLCRQNKPGCEWELIVSEEVSHEHLPMGEKAVYKYIDRLNAAGCVKISYDAVEKHIPLMVKWIRMAKISETSSIGFILQAADCYSGPDRLIRAKKLLDEGAMFIHSGIHQYYDIINGNIYRLNAGKAEMCYSMGIFKDIIPDDRARGINKALYNSFLKNTKKIVRHIAVDHTSYSTTALYIHGFNSITPLNSSRINEKYKIDMRLEDIIPEDVAIKLRGCAKYAENWEIKHYERGNDD